MMTPESCFLRISTIPVSFTIPMLYMSLARYSNAAGLESLYECWTRVALMMPVYKMTWTSEALSYKGEINFLASFGTCEIMP